MGGGLGCIESYMLSADPPAALVWGRARHSYTGFSSFVDGPEADSTSLQVFFVVFFLAIMIFLRKTLPDLY